MGVGADSLHVAAYVQQHGNRAQTAHDAADAQRVGDGLPQAVALGDLEVDDRRRPIAADLEHGDDVVRPVEGAAAVGGGLEGRSRLQRGRHPPGDDLRRAQPLGVDVVQADRRTAQFGKAEDVTQQILGEDGAAGTDERDLGHWTDLRGDVDRIISDLRGLLRPLRSTSIDA
jgi:hypothetical protein